MFKSLHRHILRHLNIHQLRTRFQIRLIHSTEVVQWHIKNVRKLQFLDVNSNSHRISKIRIIDLNYDKSVKVPIDLYWILSNSQ